LRAIKKLQNSHNENNKMSFDSYLKSKGEFFVMKKNHIRPSADFVDETIRKIEQAHEHRMLVTKILFVSYMFIPFILREVWYFARNDYFSLGRWPLGEYLVSAYTFLIASTTGVYLLIIGALSAITYLWGYRLILAPTFKYIGHFFNREQRARA
jgi:hypothetical protein